MEKMSRKLKKRILGVKLNRRKLKSLLNSVVIGETVKTIYEEPNIKPYLFCPKCGCVGMRGTGNMTEYPEHWENFYCIRCKFLVGAIDNSPFIHSLMFADDNYKIL